VRIEEEKKKIAAQKIAQYKEEFEEKQKSLEKAQAKTKENDDAAYNKLLNNIPKGD